VRIFKKVALVFFILLVVAVVVAAIVYRPYYKMPPEPTEVLDVKLAQYRAIVEAGRDRPKNDREALDTLAIEMQKSIEHKILWKDECPPYTPEFLETQKPAMEKIAVYEDRFLKLLQDGFVIQHDGHHHSDIPNFSPLRMFIYQQIATAVMDMYAGQKDQTLIRLDQVGQIIEGFERVPSLIFVLMGLAMEIRLNEVIVYLLPSLEAEDIQILRAKVAGFPDGRAMLLDGMKAETAAFVKLLDHSRDGTDIPGLPEGADRGDSFGPFSGLAKATGFLTRERYMYLSLMSREITAMDDWLAAGPDGKHASVIGDEKKYGLISRMAVPNLPSLMDVARKYYQKRRALLEAMDLEIIRRQTASETALEVPYGEGKKIVLNSEYGCIVDRGKKQ